MERLTPPSREAGVSVAEAVGFLGEGNREEAARWLEASFTAASFLLFAANDLRAMSEAVGRGAALVNPEPSPMRSDWMYYAAVAVKFELIDSISDSQMLDAIRLVEVDRLLSDVGSPLAQYVQGIEV